MKTFEKNEITLLTEIAYLFKENKKRIVDNWAAQQDTPSPKFGYLKEGIETLVESFIENISKGNIDDYLKSNSAIGKKVVAADISHELFIDSFHEFEGAYANILMEKYGSNVLHPMGVLDQLHHKTISILAREYGNIKDATIYALAKLAESRDPETGAHLERTREYSKILAEQMKCDEDFVENIYAVSPLHDIGKVAIPDGILLKPAGLTKEEFGVMKTHVQKGKDCLDSIIGDYKIMRGDLVIARDIAQCHHEKWDGTGYPNGWKGENIPLAARIFTIADIYDALRSKRPYKSAFSHEEAVSIITKGMEEQCLNILIQKY